jgi:hypothetical protein
VPRSALARFERFDSVRDQRDDDLTNALIQRRLKAEFFGAGQVLRIGPERSSPRTMLTASELPCHGRAILAQLCLCVKCIVIVKVDIPMRLWKTILISDMLYTVLYLRP